MSKLQNIQSMIGYGLPYVFVEKIKLTQGTLRKEDRSSFVDNNPVFKRNKFGRNESQKKSELDNKDYFTDEVIGVSLSLSVPELFLGRRWFGKRAAKGMVIRIVQSAHPLATERLMKSGRYSEESLPYELRPFVTEKALSIPMQIDLSSYKTKEISELGDILCLVPLDVTFNANSKHLTYFLYTESGNHIGKKTIEKVMDKGRTKRTTTCFYLPNGNVWSGPVHVHDGVWMAGARHTTKSHPVLDKMDHNNVKIQDFRIFERLKKIQNNIFVSRKTESRRIFSDLFLSRDADSAARGLLVMNVERFLTANSRFNNLFFTADTDKLMSYTEIQSLKVIRAKKEKKNVNDFDYVDQKDMYEVVAESSDHPTKKFLVRKDKFIDENMDGVVEKYIGTVSEKKLTGLGRKRAFSFYDSKIKEFEEGEYNYGVEVTMTDPTIKYLERQVRGLKKAHRILNEYYQFASDKRYFNYKGELDMQAIKFLGNIYGSSGRIEKRNSFNSFPWRRAVKIYLTVLGELTGEDPRRYAKRLYAILGPTSKNLDGVEAFLKLLEGLIQKLLSYGITVEQTYSNKRSRASSNKKQEATLLEISHFFDNTFDAGIVKEYGIDYYGDFLTKNYTGPMTISTSNLHKRFAKEAERTGTTRPSPQNIENYKKFYSTLSPIRVRTNTDDYNLEDLSNMSAEDLRRVRAQVSKMRNRSDDQGVNTPDNGGSTYEILRSILRQQGAGAVLELYQSKDDDPCDPEVKKSPKDEGGGTTGSDNFLPGGKDDNFTTKETNKPSGDTQKPDSERIQVTGPLGLWMGHRALEILEALGSKQDEGDILSNEGVKIKYITNFTEDMDIVFVDAPFDRGPFLTVLENTEAQDEKDTTNTALIVGLTDDSEPENRDEDGEKKPPVDTEEGPPDEPEDDGEEEGYLEGTHNTMDASDNAEVSSDISYNTGAEEVAVKATTSRMTQRVAVVPAPPTVVRTEQQQTYLVGVAPTDTDSGGDRGGY